MDGLALFRLGRTLTKLGEQAIPPSLFHRLPASVRLVLADVMDNPDSSVSEITRRTGFPQSHVSAAVARLRDEGVLVTDHDPKDRRRTLVRPHADVPARAAQRASVPIDDTVAAALGTDDPRVLTEVLQALETLARRFPPHA
ncbi:MarR family winged helix-turn-helix transcriptional regulator [Allokutzneria albata]|uniref:MarR family winged helix-turn-helix transcriptional regulator n=1 Tax=Allokutzneria albata TaxID=211114 RepID=UPI0005C22F31|nr:MarR family transcriptional regulator [Allokutzneria albata]